MTSYKEDVQFTHGIGAERGRCDIAARSLVIGCVCEDAEGAEFLGESELDGGSHVGLCLLALWMAKGGSDRRIPGLKLQQLHGVKDGYSLLAT